VLILVAWGLIAILGLVGSVAREEWQELDIRERLKKRSKRNEEALKDILTAMLRPDGVQVGSGYSCTVYTYDDEHKRLEPVFPIEPADARELRSFLPGKGVTGLAYQRGKNNSNRRSTCVATDDSVSDASYGLTPGQQQFFRPYRAVAATPIWVQDLVPAGTLTAISETNDGFYDFDVNRLHFEALAKVVGQVLYATVDPEDVVARKLGRG
jgi:hypothetical protein